MYKRQVHFPTGTIFACDPLVELEDALPFLQTIPAGTYPVKICVVPSEKYGDLYACVKVEGAQEKPVRYELGMTCLLYTSCGLWKVVSR